MDWSNETNKQTIVIWLFCHIPVKKIRPHLLTGLITFLGLSGMLYFGLSFQTSRLEPLSVVSAEAVTVNISPIVMAHSEPTRLRIPNLNIDTSFVSLGLKADGTMQTPSNGKTVGWYKNAPTPGELGPAIVAGHVDTKAGPAVFWNLGKLVPGDIVEVDRADLTTAKFKVDKVAQYPQAEFPSEEVYGNINYAGIRLITCGGVFSQTTKHYSHNTIVFGSLISE